MMSEAANTLRVPTQATPPDSTGENPSRPASSATPEELALLAALRQGDEAAFLRLVEQYQPTMIRIATIYVGNRAVAEEVAQDAWIGVLRGLPRFEARSSLRTWILRIVVNRAKTRAVTEGRSVPFSSLWESDDPSEPIEDPSQFLPADHPRWPGHWASFPPRWEQVPEDRLLARETMERIRAAIEALPATQRTVITLRDIAGLSSEETCNVLGITEINQRVLLHRARTQVRRALSKYLVGN